MQCWSPELDIIYLTHFRFLLVTYPTVIISDVARTPAAPSSIENHTASILKYTVYGISPKPTVFYVIQMIALVGKLK